MSGSPSSDVSVLIPCRNAEQFLGATIESALTQTCPPMEVIVVDDGSTDRSRRVAEQFGSGVRVLDSPGRGASAARNHAAASAAGQFHQYLDADDLLAPHALESRVEALRSSGARVAISDWRRLEWREGTWAPGEIESGNLAGMRPPLDLRVFHGFWAPPAAILYHRALFGPVMWREALPVIQDARFLFDVVRGGAPVVHVPGAGAEYRQHASGSLSSASAPRFWNDVLENARDVEALWAVDRVLDDEHRRALADAYSLCARSAVRVDGPLFARSCAELRRFAEHRTSRFGRAAVRLHSWFGAGVARAVLKAAHR